MRYGGGRKGQEEARRLPGGPGLAMAPVRFADRDGCIAQLVEQLTLNQRAVGSSPTAPTNRFAPMLSRVGETAIGWLPHDADLFPLSVALTARGVHRVWRDRKLE